MSDLYIARQPIVDERLKVFAYELLFRGPGERDASAIDHGHATSSLLLSAFVDGGPEDVVDGKPAFINVPPELVIDGAARMLPREGVIIELDRYPTDDETPQLRSAVGLLREEGYRFCLDRFEPDAASAAAWCEAVDFVKVDMRQYGSEELERLVAANPSTMVIATHVETHEAFSAYKCSGAHGYQGYFLCRPQIVESGDIRGARRGTLQTLSATALARPELEATIKRDPVLSYRLLRVANSSFYNRGAPAQSIRRALDLLGLEGVRQWIMLLAMAQIEGKPRPVLDVAMIRARACELLAHVRGGVTPEHAFMVGMFSLLDALMDRPLDLLLDRLPVEENVKNALLSRDGELGELLSCVVAQERGDFTGAQLAGVDRSEVQTAYLEAIRWVRDVGGLVAA